MSPIINNFLVRTARLKSLEKFSLRVLQRELLHRIAHMPSMEACDTFPGRGLSKGPDSPTVKWLVYFLLPLCLKDQANVYDPVAMCYQTFTTLVPAKNLSSASECGYLASSVIRQLHMNAQKEGNILAKNTHDFILAYCPLSLPYVIDTLDGRYLTEKSPVITEALRIAQALNDPDDVAGQVTTLSALLAGQKTSVKSDEINPLEGVILASE